MNQNETYELKHYGVLGMKWGVRRTPEQLGHEKPSGKAWDVASSNKVAFSDVQKISFGREKGYLTPFGAGKKKDDESFLAFVDEKYPGRYASESDAKTALSKFRKTDNPLPPDSYQQIYMTNHYAPNEIRKVNCFHCSMAFEMRCRGYNVQSKEIEGGWGPEARHAFAVKDGFNVRIGEKIDPNRSIQEYVAAATECYNQIEKQCLAYGEGARGCLGIQYIVGGGHSMSWIVKDGKFQIIDSQQNADGKDLVRLSFSNIDVYRLDNAEVLPGVTDFVESFEHTEEEIENIKNAIDKASTRKERVEENERKRREAEIAKRIAEANRSKRKVDPGLYTPSTGIEKAKKVVNRTIRKIKKATKDLVEAGKKFLANPLNIKTTTTINRLYSEEIRK